MAADKPESPKPRRHRSVPTPPAAKAPKAPRKSSRSRDAAAKVGISRTLGAGQAAKRPPRTQSLLLVGWQATTGEWKTDSPAGRLLGALSIGCFMIDAAAAAGLARQTPQNWVTRGGEHRGPDDEVDRMKVAVADRPYVDFARAAEKADARLKLRASAEWTRAGKKDWRAWERFLQQRYPDQYKKPTERLEATVNLLASDEWTRLQALIMGALEPFPDAWAAVAAAVAEAEGDKTAESSP